MNKDGEMERAFTKNYLVWGSFHLLEEDWKQMEIIFTDTDHPSSDLALSLALLRV